MGADRRGGRLASVRHPHSSQRRFTWMNVELGGGGAPGRLSPSISQAPAPILACPSQSRCEDHSGWRTGMGFPSGASLQSWQELAITAEGFREQALGQAGLHPKRLCLLFAV